MADARSADGNRNAVIKRTSQPLSILQFATAFPSWGGTELHVLNLSQQLQMRGHAVTIACRPGKWVEEQARAMGIATVPFCVQRQFDLHDLAAVRRFVRERKIDVIHTHWSTDTFVSGFAGMLEHVPVRVLSRHMPYPFKNRVGTYLYSRLLFTRMVTVSGSVRKTLLASGVSPDRVEVIHHGTDVESFERVDVARSLERTRLGLPNDCIAIGIVGRIAPEKGHQVFLEAARRLGETRPIYFVIVGSGPDEETARATVATLGLENLVHFAGFRTDVNNVINALDIIAVPSIWNEPCSAVVQQAMALSKPVIGTLTGGTPEMVIDQVTGLLVAPSDADALANAMSLLASDAALREKMGEAGHQRVEDHFSLHGMVDKIEDLYRRELSRKRGTRDLRGALAS